MANGEGKYKCQINWSEQTGYLLNVYEDDPQKAATLFKQLREEMGMAYINEEEEREMGKENKEPVPVEDTSKPFCSKCQKEMELKTNSKTGNKFWGCPSYPKCRETKPY